MSLVDQYSKKQKLGSGGGYKLIADNGYGKKHYRDYDPVTGIKRELFFDGEGNVTHRVTQMNASLKKFADTVKENHKPFAHTKRGGGFEQQALIPIIDYFNILKRCGWKPGTAPTEVDNKKLDRILNDSNEPVMKTRPGRISTRKMLWY